MAGTDLEGKRILVTHADGFMGPTLCEVLKTKSASTGCILFCGLDCLT